MAKVRSRVGRVVMVLLFGLGRGDWTIKEKLKDLKAEDICKWRPDILKVYLEEGSWRFNGQKKYDHEQSMKLVREFDRQMQPKISSPGRGIIFLGE